MALTVSGPSFDLGTLSSSPNGEDVDVTTLGNGLIVAVWDEALVSLGNGVTDDEGIFGCLYNDDGTPASAVFQVHGAVDLSEYRPAVTALAGGGFVVTWHQNADHDFSTGFFDVDVMAQVFDASGTAVGDTIEVFADDPIGNSTADDQSVARPFALADGGFIVTWEQGDSAGAMGQRFDANGTPVGPAVAFFAATVALVGGIGQPPNAVQLVNGDIAVVTSINNALVVQFSDATLTGAPAGTSGATGPMEWQITTREGTFNTSSTPAVAAHPNGSLIVVSVVDQGYFADAIQVDLITPAGAVVSSVQIVRNVAFNGTLMAPQVAVRPDGSFAVIWEDKATPDALDIVMAEFGADGALIGDVIVVNDTKAGNQVDPSITVTDDGAYFVTYIDEAASGAVDEVRGILVTTDTGSTPEPVIDGKTLTGTAAADRLVGGARNDFIKGRGGDDTLVGRGGQDIIRGDNGNDTLRGDGGHDDLAGGKGHDSLYGGTGNDTLKGNGGNDKLFGNKGRDVLEGGGGTDQLTGGDGADSFVFAKGMGRDVIKDFEDDVDTIVLDNALWGRSTNPQVIINTYATVVGNDIVFDFGNGNSLRIEGFTDLLALVDDLTIV